MDVFDILTMVGGLCLFLFGMTVMGQALERRAGNSLRTVLGKLTSNRAAGFLTGVGVTAVIQSSSATTVMVVGFVNSGLLMLKQAIGVIMGANVGTTVTAWVLSLSGIDGENVFVQLLKPTSFTPILALIGVIFFIFCKKNKTKDTGMILLGFATLMFGMDTMSAAVAGLKDVPAFRELFLLFQNPLLGMLAGAILTAIIQSSSASVGILQALASTGQISLGAAIPIIMGQNIGTCITALLSSVGTNKNARRTALVHLLFNVIGTTVWLSIFWIVDLVLHPTLFDQNANVFNIAVAHSAFNILCTALLMPMGGLLEKIVIRLIPDDKSPDTAAELDSRLLNTPPIALERCRTVATEMAQHAVQTVCGALDCVDGYTPEKAELVRENEETTDHYEDILGSYLVKLSSMSIGDAHNAEAAMLLKAIGDFERISDHGVNILESIEELRDKEIVFSESAANEMNKLVCAVREILDLTLSAFTTGDVNAIVSISPLEEVIDDLKDALRSAHIRRLQQGDCTIDAGFIWSDLLTDLERVSDHCSNIAIGIVDLSHHDMNIHENLRAIKADDEHFRQSYTAYREKYALS